jgi:metal-sulfur cluster biosynthetic enzyme
MSDAPPTDVSGEPDDSDPTPCAYTTYQRGDGPADVPATGDGAEGVERSVWDALYSVEDPEMPVSIVDLGLIYGVDVDEASGTATVEMTLTYTGCPARTMLLSDVESTVESVDGVSSVAVRLVWSPEWTVEMVTEAGREELREFGVSI